jgi:hypothetical protein
MMHGFHMLRLKLIDDVSLHLFAFEFNLCHYAVVDTGLTDFVGQAGFYIQYPKGWVKASVGRCRLHCRTRLLLIRGDG